MTAAFSARLGRRFSFLVIALLAGSFLTSVGLLADAIAGGGLSDGLIAHWPLDEGTGSNAYDAVGGYAAELQGRSTWATGEAGSGVQLDGTRSYLAAPPLDAYGTGLTMAAWVQIPSYPGATEQSIISKGAGNAREAFYWTLGQFREGSSYFLRFRLRTDGQTTRLVAPMNGLTPGKWYHVAATYDGSTMRVFFDGADVGQTAKSGSIDTNPKVTVNIGRSSDGGNYLRGIVDDIRIYNRALGGDEIANLASGNTNSAPDNAAPSVPAGLTATAVAATQVQLQWTASSDDIAVTGYRVRRNGTVLSTTGGTSYQDTSAVASTTYSYTVSAFDAAGNESAPSTAASATTPATDTQAPRISSVTASGVTDTDAVISWTTDESATSALQYGTSTSYGASANDPALTKVHAVRVAALKAATTYHYVVASTDATGNVGRGTDLTFTTAAAANKPPVVTLTSPSANASYLAPASMTLTASASDPENRLSSVDFFVGNTLLSSDTSAPFTFTWSPVPAGSYTLSAVAKDADGGSANSPAVTVTVSTNRPPTVAITSPTSGSTVAALTDIVIAATASDPESRMSEVQFYAGSLMLGRATSAPYSFRWPAVAAGVYSLTAVARDADGGYATSAPVSISVVASSTASWQVAFTASPDHYTLVSRYVLDVFVAGANVSTTSPVVSSDLGKPTPNASGDIVVDRTALFQALAPGSYVLTVTAVGSGGSARSAPLSFTR